MIRRMIQLMAHGTVPPGRSFGKVPKMPYFDEERDFMDSYLGRFERFAESQKWRREDWAMYLSALLKGRALDVYSMMPTEYANDYDQLKDALLKRYQLSADGFKKRFRSAKPEAGETPIQFLTRLDNYLLRWIELAKADKSFDGLKTLIVQEQYLSTCPTGMAMHLKEGKPRTIRELGEVAENYVEAHATDIVFGIEPRQHRIRNLQSEPRRCHICGETGHLRNQCPRRSPDPKPLSPPRPQRMPPLRTPPSQRQQWQTQQQKPALRCFLCNKPGHIARNCMIKPAAAAVEFQTQGTGPDESHREDTVPKTLGSRSPPRNIAPPRTCRKHNWVDCGACLNPVDPTHHCQAAAMIAICQDCGKHHPVIADACQSQEKCHRMPKLPKEPSRESQLPSSATPAVLLSLSVAHSFQTTS